MAVGAYGGSNSSSGIRTILKIILQRRAMLPLRINGDEEKTKSNGRKNAHTLFFIVAMK